MSGRRSAIETGLVFPWRSTEWLITMSEAQLGLMTATPIIIVFAIALRKMGVLSTVATVSAVSLSVAIAMVLFTTQ
jgi:hypothetical protein